MRKGSPQDSRNSRPGSNNKFRKDDSSGSFGNERKPSFKKNYDGRSPSSGDDRPSRPAKPYSGRVADSSKPFRSADKPFGKESKAAGRDGAERKPRKEFDKPRRDGDSRPFSDRPKKNFDKPAFGKSEGRNGPERKPRKEFDKPGRDNDSRPFSDRPKKTFDKPSLRKEGDSRPPRKEFDKPSFRKDGDSRPPRKEFDKPSFRKDGDSRPPRKEFDKPSFRKDGDSRPPRKEFDKPDRDNDKPRKSADSRPFRERPKEERGDKKKPFSKGSFAGKTRKPEASRPFSEVMDDAFKQPKSKKKEPAEDDIIFRPEEFEDQVFGELDEPAPSEVPKRPFEKKPLSNPGKKKYIHDHSEGRKKKNKEEDDDDIDEEDKEINQKDGPRLEMPLNKYIAHSGECSRRDAAELVRQGKVKVNGELVLDPGYRVQHDDKVTMSGKKLTPQKGMVYILLNKPKGFITTNDDPQGRRTVMELVGNADVDRLFPVGRLDRDTSGLLLITNDGDLTQKLCHPSYSIKKVYQVTLDKPVTHADFDKILAGVDLEDGIAKVDALSYLETKSEIGLEIHSGRNRIVRRIFESLGYEVVKLDRVMYAGLTKKNLPRSKWRYLEPREVVLLKHFKS
jgi:23S rRNA pseudouridine2605 synthase